MIPITHALYILPVIKLIVNKENCLGKFMLTYCQAYFPFVIKSFLSIFLSKCRRRDSLGLPQIPPNKDIEHPSDFPSLLRKDPLVASMVTLRKDGYFNSGWNARRDSLTGSTNSLKKDFLQVPNANRRNSRRFSSDSLDSRRNSWDPGRRGSCGSSGGWDDPNLENERKVRILICF